MLSTVINCVFVGAASGLEACFVAAFSDELSLTVSVDGGHPGGEIRKTEEAIQRLSTVLREVSQEATLLLDPMNGEGRAPSLDIQKSISEIGVHEKVGSDVSEILGGLSEVIAVSSVSKGNLQTGEVIQYMKSIETSYTMVG